jgi:hypothetical protein
MIYLLPAASAKAGAMLKNRCGRDRVTYFRFAPFIFCKSFLHPYTAVSNPSVY